MTAASFRKLSVLVPVPSSAHELYALHEALSAELQGLAPELELLYLVGTADPETLAQVERVSAEAKPGVRILRFADTVGEAPMLSAAADEAEGDLLLTLPARFEVDLGELGGLLEAVRDGTQLAIAARRRRESGNAARRQSELFNRLMSWAAGSHFHDIASGTRALRPAVLKEIPLYGEFHRYLPVLAERAGFDVREVAVAQDSRARPPSVHPPFLYLWRALDVLAVFFISRFTRHPLRLFGGVGAAFAGVGGLMLLLLGLQRLLGTPLGNRPLLVLATLLVGLGVQTFTIGLLGELILFFHARGIRDYRLAAVQRGSQAGSPAARRGADEPEPDEA